MTSRPSIEQRWDELHALHRRQLWFITLQSLACAVLGAIAGFLLALGYLADLPPWLMP